MQYVFLIYGDPRQEDTPELMARYGQFTQDVITGGAMRGGHQLQRAPTARLVSVRNGRTLVTDGPYAEKKEVMGGFYILDCRDLDEALEYAAKIPDAKHAAVEVRPVMHVPGWDYGPTADRQRQAMA